MSSYSELLDLFNKCYETRKCTDISNCNYCYFSKYTEMLINVISVVNRSYKDLNNTVDLSLIRDYMDKYEDDEMLIITKNSIDKIKNSDNEKEYIDWFPQIPDEHAHITYLFSKGYDNELKITHGESEKATTFTN